MSLANLSSKAVSSLEESDRKGWAFAFISALGMISGLLATSLSILRSSS